MTKESLTHGKCYQTTDAICLTFLIKNDLKKLCIKSHNLSLKMENNQTKRNPLNNCQIKA